MLGIKVIELEKTDDLPDSVFVEDVAVVTKDFAIITNPRFESRRKEVAHIIKPIQKHIAPLNPNFKILHIASTPEEISSAFFEGGDVVRFGKRHFIVGLTERTNMKGFKRFQDLLSSLNLGYTAEAIPLKGPDLHMKCLLTYLRNGELIGDMDKLKDYPQLTKRKILGIGSSSYSANVVSVNGNIMICKEKTPAELKNKLEEKGFNVFLVENSEFSKLDGDMTCRSLLF